MLKASLLILLKKKEEKRTLLTFCFINMKLQCGQTWQWQLLRVPCEQLCSPEASLLFKMSVESCFCSTKVNCQKKKKCICDLYMVLNYLTTVKIQYQTLIRFGHLVFFFFFGHLEQLKYLAILSFRFFISRHLFQQPPLWSRSPIPHAWITAIVFSLSSLTLVIHPFSLSYLVLQDNLS